MARKFPMSNVKVLYGEAANRCNFPGCEQDLAIILKGGKKKQIGKIAHIVAHSPYGPRGDSLYPKEKLDTYENWILFCGTHHDIIDKDVGEYTIKKLREMKENHENWVKSCISTAVMNVGFTELENVINVLVSSEAMKAEEQFDVIPPAKKIKKNNLSASIHNFIVMGISRNPEVIKYIENQQIYDDKFSEKLAAGFKKEYDKLYTQEGLNGDELFKRMLDFACGGVIDFERKAAGLVVLSYLFEICEVFEK